MPTLLELLRDGYFPKELPPPFETQSSFATLMASQRAVLPASITSGNLPNGRPSAFVSPHHITRVGQLQRRLGIPNPIAHFRLCKEIAQHWSALYQFTQGSQLSASRPTSIPGSLRAIVPENTQGSLPIIRTNKHLGGRYLVKADITRFYHSIYTHSIPWALHGKPFAKRNRRSNNLGNRLDTLVRNSQDEQTIGIPVGPDTSLLLAEVVLTAADKMLVTELGPIDGFRYIDDYELCFPTLAEAENALYKLESVFSVFELALNPSKTAIHSAPFTVQDHWAADLMRFQIRTTSITAQRNDLTGYFNLAIELVRANPEKSVLNYAISRLRSTVDSASVDSANVPHLQNLLLHCVSSEQGTIPRVLELMSRLYNNGYPAPRAELAKVLNSQIKYHAPLDHTSEVAWCLWGAIAFNVRMHTDTADVVSKMDDSIVALLALDADSRRLFATRLNTSNWTQYMTQQALYEENWLLSYEANVKGWLQSPTGVDHAAADRNFGFLKRNGVEFYDLANTVPMVPKATQPLPGPPSVSPG